MRAHPLVCSHTRTYISVHTDEDRLSNPLSLEHTQPRMHSASNTLACTDTHTLTLEHTKTYLHLTFTVEHTLEHAHTQTRSHAALEYTRTQSQ